MNKPTEHKQRYSDYLKSKEWASLKNDLIQNRGLNCEDCGCSKKSASLLHVHHVTYERLFNEEPDDLVILCAECHAVRHNLLKNGKIVKRRKGSKKKKKPAILVDTKKQRLAKNAAKTLKRIERRVSKGYYSSASAYHEAKAGAMKRLKKYA